MMSECCEDGVASESAEGDVGGLSCGDGDSEEAIIGTVITLSVSLLEALIARNTSLGDSRWMCSSCIHSS